MTNLPRRQRLAIAGFVPGPHPVPRDIAILIRGIVERGIDVDLLLPPGQPLPARDLGCAVESFPLNNADEPAALEDLRAYLRERRPNALLSNRDRSGRLLAHLSPRERPRSVLRIGTNVVEKLGKKNIFVRARARRQLADAFAAADALIGISDGACAALRQLLADRDAPPVHRIYNCIDLEEANRLAAQPVPHPWLTDKDRPVILSVGRLVRVKDYPTLIKAFRRVRERRDCRLLILGEGRQRPRLEKLVRKLHLQEDVSLPGFDANPFAYMRRADVFALSSLFEGFGHVLIEALAVGLPCVATDCRSGPDEILGYGEYGRIASAGDHRALADALLATLSSPPDAGFLREALRRFTPETAVAAYLRVLGLTPAP